MRTQGHGHERKVRTVRQQIAVQSRIVGKRTRRPHPDMMTGLLDLGCQRIDGIDRHDLDGSFGHCLRVKTLGDPIEPRLPKIALAGKPLRSDDVGHRRLVVEALFLELERSGQVEDGSTGLNCDDTSSREALTVTDSIDVVDDWAPDISRTQEVGM